MWTFRETAWATLVFCAWAGTGLSAKAEVDYPTAGLIYHTTENSALTFNCMKAQDGLIDCEFNQTFVRKKAKPEDLIKKIEEAKKQFPAAVKELRSEETCRTIALLAPVVRGDQTPEQALQNLPKNFSSSPREFIDGMNSMTEAQKQDLLDSTELIGRFCAAATIENFLEIVKSEHTKEVRTCKIGSNAFKQRFRWVSDYQSGTGAWVVESSRPEGPCGLINLSRFEPVLLPDSKITFWRYYAKRAVTNPKGSVFLDMKCKDLDEGEYQYDWKARDLKLGCDYVEFSVF